MKKPTLHFDYFSDPQTHRNATTLPSQVWSLASKKFLPGPEFPNLWHPGRKVVVCQQTVVKNVNSFTHRWKK